MSSVDTAGAQRAVQGAWTKAASLRPVWILAAISLVLLVCAFLVSPGLFNIDEFIVLAGAKALLANGALTVQNGWPEFSSPDLSLWLLVQGPHGLTPQYPAGTAVLGAPLLAIFGARGLMLINVAAGIGTLFVLWALSARHFGRKAVALVSVLLLLCASFWLEYVFAIWPHSVGVFSVALALLLVLDGLDAEGRFELKAAGAGAAIGLGLLFRADTVLALPAIGLVALLFAKRPFRLLIAFGLGLLPFIALTAGANDLKFGSLNPVSYGQTTGGTTLSAHIVPVVGLAVVSLLLVGLRFVRWRPGKREYAIGLGVVALILVFSEVIRELGHRYLLGAWALLFDATAVHDPRSGVHKEAGGVLSYWGLWKKALGQSMPWLGLLGLAVFRPKDSQLRRSIWVVLLLTVVWSLPFFMTTWHGGMGSNMRYFLPIVPLLCALCARLLIDFVRPIAHAPQLLILGGLAGAAAIAVWTSLHPTHTAGAQQILSTWMLLAIAGLAALSCLAWSGRKVVQAACVGAIGAGLAASMLFLVADFRQAQCMRRASEVFSEATAGLPDHALVYAPSRFISRWTFEPGHIAALTNNVTGAYDYTLIDGALAKGYRVLIWPNYVSGDLRARYGTRLIPAGVTFPGGEFLEITPVAG